MRTRMRPVETLCAVAALGVCTAVPLACRQSVSPGVQVLVAVGDPAGSAAAATPDPARLGVDFVWNCGSADLRAVYNVIYVSPRGTDSDACGASIATACKTVQRGLDRCAPAPAAPPCSVLVEYGEYTESVALRDGINLYGGCLPASESSPDDFSVFTAPPGGRPVMTAANIGTGAHPWRVEVWGLRLVGSAAIESSAPSTAVVVDNSRLLLAHTSIYAGAGAPGAHGVDASPGNPGDAAIYPYSGANKSCASTEGGVGGVENTPQRVVDPNDLSRWRCTPQPALPTDGKPGAAGTTGVHARRGGVGSPLSIDCTYEDAGEGRGGVGGTNGACGAGGLKSGDPTGSIADLQWRAAKGGDGGHGGDGGGGGGGGAGGWKCGYCLRRLQGFYWQPGDPGGGGGAGGCGAGPGGGGQQGGASIGLIGRDSELHFFHARFIGGVGGVGGAGGNGGNGGDGGNGSIGIDSGTDGGRGGNGGNGGNGGGSGGGAGGNGGPSILLAAVGRKNKWTENFDDYFPGRAGAGGKGGLRGGESCDNRGDDGVPGTVVSNAQF